MVGPTTVSSNASDTTSSSHAPALNQGRPGGRDPMVPFPVHEPNSSGHDATAVISIPLLQQFCEQLVAEAVASAREELPDTEPPEIDWQRLWVSDPTAAPELAAGHAAVTAQRIASEVLGWKQSVLGNRGVSRPPASGVATEMSVTVPPSPPLPPLPPPGQLIQPNGGPRESTTVPSLDAHERLRRRNRRLRRAFVAFGWMRDVGLILIAFAAWQLWGTSIVQSQAQQALRQQFESHLPSPARTGATPVGPALLSAAIRVPEPPNGSVVGRLRIPVLGVDQYVVEGTSETDLTKGPGHYVGTSMPGQAGNVAIAGHRTTYGAPFNNLNELKVGDEISLTSNSGEQLTYLVSASPAAVSPQDVAVLNDAADNRLTLTTCNPRFSSSQRLIVVAELNGPHTVDVAPKVGATSTVGARQVRIVTEPIGWNTGYIPIVLLLAALLIGLGLANRRARHIYGRMGRWLVLTPVWVAGLFFLFESLSRLLPANL